MTSEQEWYAISEPAGVTFPPCASCGAWKLEIHVQESEQAPTGFLAWVACKACGIEQWVEVDS